MTGLTNRWTFLLPGQSPGDDQRPLQHGWALRWRGRGQDLVPTHSVQRSEVSTARAGAHASASVSDEAVPVSPPLQRKREDEQEESNYRDSVLEKRTKKGREYAKPLYLRSRSTRALRIRSGVKNVEHHTYAFGLESVACPHANKVHDGTPSDYPRCAGCPL